MPEHKDNPKQTQKPNDQRSQQPRDPNEKRGGTQTMEHEQEHGDPKEREHQNRPPDQMRPPHNPQHNK